MAILKSLENLENSIEEKSEVSLFENKNGIQAMLDILLEDAEKESIILTYGNYSHVENILEFQSLHWRKSRINKKIMIRAIVEKSPDPNKNDFLKNSEYRELKILEGLSNVYAYTVITPNYCGYFNQKGVLSGILIKNKEISGKERFVFNILWKSAKKFN